MAQNSAQNLRDGIPIQDAWFEFASDQLRAELERDWEPDPTPIEPTIEKIMHGLSELARSQQRSAALRREAIEQLRENLAAGLLLANGLPPPIDGKFQRAPIEAAFWDTATIDVKTGTATAMEVIYAAVRVHFPSEEIHTPVVQQPALQISVDDFPSAPGATSYEDVRTEAILHCYKSFQNFGRMRLDRRLQKVVEYVEKHYPNIDTRRGFDRSSYYATVKSLEAAGRLPSNNVQ